MQVWMGRLTPVHRRSPCHKVEVDEVDEVEVDEVGWRLSIRRCPQPAGISPKDEMDRSTWPVHRRERRIRLLAREGISISCPVVAGTAGCSMGWQCRWRSRWRKWLDLSKLDASARCMYTCVLFVVWFVGYRARMSALCPCSRNTHGQLDLQIWLIGLRMMLRKVCCGARKLPSCAI